MLVQPTLPSPFIVTCAHARSLSVCAMMCELSLDACVCFIDTVPFNTRTNTPTHTRTGHIRTQHNTRACPTGPPRPSESQRSDQTPQLTHTHIHAQFTTYRVFIILPRYDVCVKVNDMAPVGRPFRPSIGQVCDFSPFKANYLRAREVYVYLQEKYLLLACVSKDYYETSRVRSECVRLTVAFHPEWASVLLCFD